MTNAEATATNDIATGEPQGATVAPEKASSKKDASQEKGAPKGEQTAKRNAPATAPKKARKADKRATRPARGKAANPPHAESKSAKILALIGRAQGATMAEITKATTWQPHSVRGFLSTAAKKHGLKIESKQTEVGDRVYSLRDKPRNKSNRDSGRRA